MEGSVIELAQTGLGSSPGQSCLAVKLVGYVA
jgi:hypothetical protein